MWFCVLLSKYCLNFCCFICYAISYGQTLYFDRCHLSRTLWKSFVFQSPKSVCFNIQRQEKTNLNICKFFKTNLCVLIQLLIFTFFSFFLFPGKLLNGQRLLEFSITTDDRSLHQELRVRVATLWVKVDLRPGISLPHKKFRRLHHDKKSLTLWVFRLVEPYDSYGGGYLNDKVIAVHTAGNCLRDKFM